MHFQEGSRKKPILSSRGKGLQNGACVPYHYQCTENGPKGFSLAFDKWGHGESDGIHMIMTQDCPCHPNEIKHQKLSIYLVKNGRNQNVFTTEWSRDSGVRGEGGWGPDPDDWIGLEGRNGSRELGWTVFTFPVKVKERTGGVGERSGRIDYFATCDGGKTMSTSYTITQYE